MNILLINHYAGSPKMGMEYRPYYLAKEWLKMGHNVCIISASYAHIRSNQPLVNEDFQTENIDGIKYIWIKTPTYFGNGVARVKNIFVFSNKLKRNAKKIASELKPNLVIASSTYPLDNYGANKIAKLARAKYYYEVHDLWPLSPMELGGLSKWHPFILCMQIAENYAYRNVDMVISLLPKTKEYMVSHGLNEDKWRYIPNGFQIEDWENVEILPENISKKLHEIRISFSRIIAYTGSLGLANALKTFVEAAKKMSNSGVAFVLVGSGPEKVNLMKFAQKISAENVFFIDSIPKKFMPSLLSEFDFLYIGLQRQSLFRFGISPNKLIDYMMAAKPIIQAIDAGNNMVEEANCGISVQPENDDAVVEAIEKLLKLSAEELAILGANGRQFALINHDYRILAEKFLE